MTNLRGIRNVYDSKDEKLSNYKTIVPEFLPFYLDKQNILALIYSEDNHEWLITEVLYKDAVRVNPSLEQTFLLQ